MKKIIYVVLAAFSLLTFTGCLGTPDPGKAAMKFMTFLQNGEFRKFAEHIAADSPHSASEKEETVRTYEALVQDKFGEAFSRKGGIKKLKLIAESVADNGKSAKVVINIIFENGEIEDQKIDLILQKRKWLMSPF